MYCINCGKELPENARFCLYCGTKVNIEEKAQVSNEEVLINNFVNTIPFIYDELSGCTDYPYIYGYINGKVGLLDANDASMVIPCQYDKINPYFYTQSKQFAYSEVNKDGKWGFYEKGKEVIPCIYDSINLEVNHGQIYTANIGEKKGLINRDTWKTTELYDSIRFEKDGIYVNTAEKHGICNETCYEVLPCLFENFEKLEEDRWFYEGLYKVYKNQKYGIYSTKKSKYIVPCRYDEIEVFRCSVYVFGENKKYLTVDLGYFVKQNEKWSIINSNGNNFADSSLYTYDEIQILPSDSVYKVCIDKKWGVIKFKKLIYSRSEFSRSDISHMSEIIITEIPCQYDDIKYFAPSIYSVEHNSKWGIMEFGKLIASCQYDNIIKDTYYSKYYVYKNERYGLIDNGGVIAPCKYECIQIVDVNIDLYLVKSNGKWGINKRTETVIIPTQYEEIQFIFHDYKTTFDPEYYVFKAKYQGKIGGIILKNTCTISLQIEYIPFDFSDIKYEPPFFYVKVGEKWGLYSKVHKIIISDLYDNITRISKFGDKFIVKQDGKYGISSIKYLLIKCHFNNIEDIKDKQILLFDTGTEKFSMPYNDFRVICTLLYRKDNKEYKPSQDDISLINSYIDKGLNLDF